MRRSQDHILTSHVGSLPRPDTLIESNRARETGEAIDEVAFQQTLKSAMTDVVRHQHELGIDIPNDGEFGKSVTYRVHYGAWWNYAFQRWGGIEFGAPGPFSCIAAVPRTGKLIRVSRSLTSAKHLRRHA